MKAPAVQDLLRLNTQSGTKTLFLTPKRYNGYPCPFLYWSPPNRHFPGNKGLHTSQVAHQAGAHLGFCSMKRLRVFLLPPGWDASPSQGYPQH